MHATRRAGPRGFTLIELLVVVTIIALISAVALPTVLPALNERRISESARLLQALLAGTRDAAIRANAPRGIRLLPDPVFYQPNVPPLLSGANPLAANRIIQIEPGPDYTEGLVSVPTQQNFGYYNAKYLQIYESGYSTVNTVNVPNNPVTWYNNIRQGDKIRFNDAGPYYTVAGPINGAPIQPASSGVPAMVKNPERFIVGPPSPVPFSFQTGWVPQYLVLMNGVDDNGNGWVDEGCDGIDNDGDGITDPGFNGIDDNGDGNIDEQAELFIGQGTNGPLSGTEYEPEVFIGSQASLPPSNEPYTIFRRPVVSPGAREVTLPAGIVIDLTTWNASTATPANAFLNGLPTLLPERSRLPVDAYTGYVDIMIDQSGRVITPGAGADGGGSYSNSPLASTPFYHFWLTEREGVVGPLFGLQNGSQTKLQGNPGNGPAGTSANYLLPMPQGTPNYSGPNLTGERRLVTLFVKTGQITSNSITYSTPNPNDPLRPIGSFNGFDTNYPYYDAQSGTKEPQ